jgi:hypothetical protein
MTTNTLVRPARREEYRTVLAEDMPAALEKGVIYLIGPAGRPWFATLLCPCGCGQKLYLNLGPRPAHSLTYKQGKVCLSPEVLADCGSRFSVYAGKLIWR